MAWTNVNIPAGVIRNATPYDIICTIKTKRPGDTNTETPLATAKGSFAMTKRIYPSAERIRQLLDYDPETGALTWRYRPVSDFRKRGRFSAEGWCAIINGRNAGKLAGNKKKTGYMQISIDDEIYPYHRIAYAHYYGECDAETIDHINGDPSDNRIENIRAATTSQNHFNRSAQRNSKSGVKGVRFFKGRYVAQINANGKRFYLGRFKTIDEASAAHRHAAEALHGEYSGHLRG